MGEGLGLGQDLCPCQWPLQAAPLCVSGKDTHPFMVCLRTKELFGAYPTAVKFGYGH